MLPAMGPARESSTCRRGWRRCFRIALAVSLLVLAVLTAGSWVKSYIRVDALNVLSGADSFILIEDINGRIWVSLSHFTHRQPVPRLRHVSFPTADSEVRYAPWTWGGLWYESWQYEPSIPPDWQCVLPHWFFLLLFLGGTCLLGRPWLRRRARVRGFEVIPKTNVSRNGATAPREDSHVAP